MWGFKRQSSTTPKPQPARRDAIETAFIAQSKALVEVIKQQQETLDRIVNARYERPFERTVQPQGDTQMPLFAMSDQGDVRPEEIDNQLRRIETATDAEWVTGA